VQAVSKWHWCVAAPTRGGGHAAGDRPLACTRCTRPHERRRPRECVRQSGGTGRTGALRAARGVRKHARDHHARVPALPAVRSSQGPPDNKTTRAVGGWCTDATTGGARPTREDVLRWVHDSATGDVSCAPLAAYLVGDVLHTAAYALWKAARKLRWVVGKGARTGGGPETRPQVAAGVARVAAAPTAGAAGLQPTRDDGAKARSGHQPPAARCSNQGPVGPCHLLPPAQSSPVKKKPKRRSGCL
jgi:hypothetical protein